MHGLLRFSLAALAGWYMLAELGVRNMVGMRLGQFQFGGAGRLGLAG